MAIFLKFGMPFLSASDCWLELGSGTPLACKYCTEPLKRGRSETNSGLLPGNREPHFLWLSFAGATPDGSCIVPKLCGCRLVYAEHIRCKVVKAKSI